MILAKLFGLLPTVGTPEAIGCFDSVPLDKREGVGKITLSSPSANARQNIGFWVASAIGSLINLYFLSTKCTINLSLLFVRGIIGFIVHCFSLWVAFPISVRSSYYFRSVNSVIGRITQAVFRFVGSVIGGSCSLYLLRMENAPGCRIDDQMLSMARVIGCSISPFFFSRWHWTSSLLPPKPLWGLHGLAISSDQLWSTPLSTHSKGDGVVSYVGFPLGVALGQSWLPYPMIAFNALGVK